MLKRKLSLLSKRPTINFYFQFQFVNLKMKAQGYCILFIKFQLFRINVSEIVFKFLSIIDHIKVNNKSKYITKFPY